MLEIKITIDDKQLQQTLKSLAEKSTLKPVMPEIAKIYAISTEQNFDNQTSPSGQRWKPNSPATQRLKLHGMKNRPPAIAGPSHVGVWSGRLATSIQWRVVGNAAIIESKQPHAGFFQMGHKAVRPWGRTPPRPFLGQSVKVERQIEAMLKRYLESGL